MTDANLTSILTSVDWCANVMAAHSNADNLAKVERSLLRVAVWSKQLEIADNGNAALSFIREMQLSAQHAAALIGLSFYKPSAASSRTMLETCMYYTYFRSHFDELATLTRVAKYYISKNDVMDFHRLHTPDFVARQEVFGLTSKIEEWYARTSAVIHGQIPGSWSSHLSLRDIGFQDATNSDALKCFVEAEDLIHQLLLCTTGNFFWDQIAPPAKAFLIKGLDGDKKSTLKLDIR